MKGRPYRRTLEKENAVGRRVKMSEEEPQVFDLMGLLLRVGGVRIGVPILVGAVLVAIGLYELPWGLMAVALGILMIAYGVIQLEKRRRAAQRTETAKTDQSGRRPTG